jgi:hypothetical protein
MKGVLARYFTHVAEVHKLTGDPKGHIEVTETTVYASLPCYIYNASNTWANRMFGMANVGRYNGIFPFQYQGNEVEIRENYILLWSDHGKKRRLLVVKSSFYDGHIQVETEEVL